MFQHPYSNLFVGKFTHREKILINIIVKPIDGILGANIVMGFEIVDIMFLLVLLSKTK